MFSKLIVELLLWPGELDHGSLMAKVCVIASGTLCLLSHYSPSTLVLVTTSLRGKVNMESGGGEGEGDLNIAYYITHDSDSGPSTCLHLIVLVLTYPISFLFLLPVCVLNLSSNL